MLIALSFFAPNERENYLVFLNSIPSGYQVCIISGRLAGAFGLTQQDKKLVSLNWILLDPGLQGQGLGSKIMTRALAIARAQGATYIQIAASHKSAPFFEKFGAVTGKFIDHGWGIDMHRVDMQLQL